MDRTRIDRRVARSRELLQQALMSLILKKDYEAITVQDICDEANVGRSTFYGHFTGKDDLKRSGLEHLRKLLAERQEAALAASNGAESQRFAFSLPMFEHAHDHLSHYRALAGGRGGAISLDCIRRILSDLMRTEVASPSQADSMPREAAVQYVTGAYTAMLTWWLDGGAKQTPQEMDAMFRRLASAGVAPTQV